MSCEYLLSRLGHWVLLVNRKVEKQKVDSADARRLTCSRLPRASSFAPLTSGGKDDCCYYCYYHYAGLSLLLLLILFLFFLLLILAAAARRPGMPPSHDPSLSRAGTLSSWKPSSHSTA